MLFCARTVDAKLVQISTTTGDLYQEESGLTSVL